MYFATIGARGKPLLRRYADTCVLVFYIWMAVIAEISGGAYLGHPKNVVAASRRWDMGMKSHAARTLALSEKVSGRCPISMRRQPHHEKIKEAEHDYSGAD